MLRTRQLTAWALAIAGALLASPQTAAKPVAPAPRLQASDAEIAHFFDDYISKTIRRLELPGAAIVVIRDGRPIFAKGYGYSDLATKRPVSIENSLFRGASISKTFTWLLVMQLVEQGRVDLDRDVNFYLDFRIPEAFGRPITMRHLMTHSAGFADRFNGVFDSDLATPLGRKLRENIPARVYAPGTVVAYSNYGGALAGYIAERVSGLPFDRLLAERIFGPVGMRRSTFAQPVPEALRPLLASNYTYGSVKPVAFRTTPLRPMGALTASPGDMGRYLAMLLGGGMGEKGRVLAPDSLRLMLTLQKGLGANADAGIGLGFLVGQLRGVHYAGHAGNMTTVATDLELLPDQGLGYYYVFNGQGPNELARKVRIDLLGAVIGKLVAPGAPPLRASGPSSAGDLAGSWIGTRRQRSGPLLMGPLMDTVDAYPEKDGTLTLVASGNETHWLPAGRDRFVEEKSGFPLAASRGPDGRVERIASPLLFPAGEYERAPFFVPWVEDVTKFSLVTLFLAVVAAPIGWAVRRRRRRAIESGARAEAVAATPSRLARITRPLARRSFWLIVLTLAGWGIFAIFVAMDMSVLFSIPAVLRIALGIMTILTAPFAAMMAVDALVAWRDPARGWAARVFGLPVAAAAVGLAWLLYMFDVTNFSGNW